MPDLKKMLTLEALSEALPSWLKRSTKPEYNADEIDSTLTTNQFVTASDKDNWNAKGTYSKPSGGIPKSDLSSIVQTSLEKADSALQSETDPTVPSWAKQPNKPSYTQDEVPDGSTYKRVTQTEKDTWSRKQNALSTTQMQAVNSGITSEKVTQIETNKTNILYSLNTGVKNLLNFSTGEIAPSVTTHGITWTISENKGVVANGTSDSSGSYPQISSLTLPVGVYKMSGGTSRIKFQCENVVDSGSGATLTVTASTTQPVIFIVYAVSSTQYTNETIYPMLCTEAAWNQSTDYQPPALPNSDLTQMVSDLQKKAVKVYTYHVNPNESDPEDAVTYLDDAAGLTPAKMGASSFSYGSWANAWFLPRPCMLKSDGTVAYYLNPNDYSKKTDGTASDITNANYDGNVMLEFPKIWVKRVAGATGERTVSIAPVNVDGTYKCWSNINADNKEIDHFYLPAYNGTIHSSKMRSLSGVTLNSTYAPNYTRAQEVTAATANNPSGKNMWYTEVWADYCLIFDLLYLMGKSLDVQRTFGQGLSSGSETAMRAYVTGTHNSKGLFYGDVSGTATAVKVLGMENIWGCRWHGVAGLINDNGTLKVKMTYGNADGSTAIGYNTTGSGYLTYGSTYGTNGYVKKIQADNTMGYKTIETSGTDATYYCDYYYTNNSQSNYALLGGRSADGAKCGFCVHLSLGAAYTGWDIGGSLSCRP